MRRVTAMARYGLPDAIELQYHRTSSRSMNSSTAVSVISAVSPITQDHINPAYAWPELRRLEELADTAEKHVVERLPVYERYLDEQREIRGPQRLDRPWVTEPVRNTIRSNDHPPD